jgi:hypothetical protein
MKTDSSGYFAITASLIAGIVFSMLIGGLISGGLAAATAAFTTEQNIGAAFWGGFVSGAIMSLGGSVALGLGPWGVLVAAGSGFLGGFLGNLVEQGISGRNVPNKSATNWNDALNAGVLYAIINTITFGIFRFYGWVGAEELLPIGGTILERVISSLSFNGYCLVTSAFFGTIMGVTETIVRVIEFYVTGGTYGYNNIEAKVMNTGIKALYVC